MKLLPDVIGDTQTYEWMITKGLVAQFLDVEKGNLCDFLREDVLYWSSTTLFLLKKILQLLNTFRTIDNEAWNNL